MGVVTLIAAVFYGSVLFLGNMRIERSIRGALMRNDLPPRDGRPFPPPDVFLQEVATFRNLGLAFLWIAIPLLLLIFLASIYFANRAIRPIERAFTKQKEFVADASHELKTPLTTISANAEVILQDSSEELQKWATNIKLESERMANLVESLLYLAKIDYEDKPHFAPLDLGEVLDDVLLPLEPIIHEKNIELQTQVADGVVVHGDKAQIHRLLGILIDNAIKYTHGKISVTIDKPAQLTVQNSGEAIPAEKLEKLFDRFYRLDEAHEYTGSFGLGLSIAKAIVDTHKGKISCKSDETGGVTVHGCLKTRKIVF
jgi:signal transduction histidine kinase